MNTEEIANKIVKDVNIKDILNKVNEWGSEMSEDEKKELFEKGGIL